MPKKVKGNTQKCIGREKILIMLITPSTMEEYKKLSNRPSSGVNIFLTLFYLFFFGVFILPSVKEDQVRRSGIELTEQTVR